MAHKYSGYIMAHDSDQLHAGVSQLKQLNFPTSSWSAINN